MYSSQKDEKKARLRPVAAIAVMLAVTVLASTIKLGMGVAVSLLPIVLAAIGVGMLSYAYGHLPVLLLLPAYALALLGGTNPIRALLMLAPFIMGILAASAYRRGRSVTECLTAVMTALTLCYFVVFCVVIYKEYGSLGYDSVRLYYSSLDEMKELMTSYAVNYNGETMYLFPADVLETVIVLMIKMIPGLFLAAAGVAAYIASAATYSFAAKLTPRDDEKARVRTLELGGIPAVIFILCCFLSVLILSWETVGGVVCLNLMLMLLPYYAVCGVRDIIASFKAPGRKLVAVSVSVLAVIMLFSQPVIGVVYVALYGAFGCVSRAIRNTLGGNSGEVE